jgi:hypothetical protein
MKALIGIVLLAGAVLYDPPKALSMLGPDAQMLGWKIKSTFNVERILSKFGGHR